MKLKKTSIVSILIVLCILNQPQSLYQGYSNISSKHWLTTTQGEFEDLVQFITITSDEHFIDYGFPGTGTEEDPYIIENIILPLYSYHNGIVVINTTKHFVIQNCILNAGLSAIILEKVAYGTAIIKNNTCYRSDVGVGVVRSNGVRIYNNTCGYHNNVGIFMYRTKYSIVRNNTCYGNDYDGIISESSSFNRIESNNCSYNFDTGIRIIGDVNDFISTNVCNYNFRGTFVNANNSTLTNNLFCYNNEYGGYLLSSKGNLTITNNVFSFSARDDGCRGGGLKNSLITNNIFSNNTLYGLVLYSDTSNNQIHHNSFLGNNLEGTSQALDHGKNNLWYDEETKEGNFWDDWTSKKPYPIAGGAEAEDKYPLNESFERISFQFFSLGSLLFFACIFLYRKRRKIFYKE